MARGNNYIPRQTITNAESIKNIPVVIDNDQLINGYAFVYENDKLVLKEVKGTGGVEQFTQLTDTPNTYATNKGKMLIVNESEDGLVYEDIPVVDTQAIKEDTLTMINAGLNVSIDTNLDGSIVINSVGGDSGETVTKLTDLSDVPAYNTAEDNSVLTKTTNGLAWQVPQSKGGGEAIKSLVEYTPNIATITKVSGTLLDTVDSMGTWREITYSDGTMELSGSFNLNLTGNPSAGAVNTLGAVRIPFPQKYLTKKINISSSLDLFYSDPTVYTILNKTTSGTGYAQISFGEYTTKTTHLNSWVRVWFRLKLYEEVV